ncbi:MAG: hypothetical protein A2289_01345 [Deltaproteobacteria bacterium RIFOXYA12_FULL_58_15]|nr:MAG: hypothetical protein A2289_01345 [Deltaproteobacteria bacterium RIFOXYA12_FULL_58_15]
MLVQGGFLLHLGHEVQTWAEEALRHLPPVDNPDPTKKFLAALTDAQTPRKSFPDVEVVRIWSDGRTPGKENPFWDTAVRHVIGATDGFDVGVLETTRHHLVTKSPISLAMLLPHPHHRDLYQLARTNDRHGVLDAVDSSFVRAGASARLCQELRTLADELILNALYDAPVEAGQPMFATTSRRVEVPCVRPIEVEVASNEESLALCVRDFFGSLTAELIVNNLRRCYESDRAVMTDRAGGAGLGLFLLLSGSSRLVFNIDPGRTTEVIFVRQHRLRPAQFKSSAPTLNLCVAASRPTTSRRLIRHPVSLAATTSAGGAWIPTVVLDMTKRGAFIAPLHELRLSPGQKLQLTLYEGAGYAGDRWGGEESRPAWQLNGLIEVTAIVKWAGKSATHGCFGFGVEFETELVESSKLVGE